MHRNGHGRPKDSLGQYRPFPTETFPEPFRTFIEQGARSMHCDQSYFALPMLSVLACAIGNARTIRLKADWEQPAIIWTAAVGESGTTKSPAFDRVVQFLHELERRAQTEWAAKMARYHENCRRSEAEEKHKGLGEAVPSLAEPVPFRCLCEDITTESLVTLLQDHPRGLLMGRDELAGWFRGFDAYRKGKGADVQRWLEMWGGKPVRVDRKTGFPRTLYVPRASVSVAGTIQPSILQTCLTSEYWESGLAARLLLAHPPRRQKRWTDEQINPSVSDEVSVVLERIFSLKPAVAHDGFESPVALDLAPEARKRWASFVDEHGEEQATREGKEAAVWAKLEAYAARFGLVIHLARWAAADSTLRSPSEVDLESVNAGIRLCQWFGREAERIYATMEESPSQKEQRELVEWIASRGGRVTTSVLQQKNRRYRPSGAAEAGLQKLVKSQFARWEVPPVENGRPPRYCVLINPEPPPSQ